MNVFRIAACLALIAVAAAAQKEPYDVCTSTATSGKANADTAIAACLPAAKQGIPGAMYVVGALLQKKQTPSAAIEGLGWLRKAADAGHPTAAYELARTAENQEAVRWLRFAACSGYAPAMSLAAERGISVEMATCPKRDAADFNGTWVGVLKALKPADAKDLELRITLDRGAVRVAVKRNGEWSDVKPGKFTVAQKDGSLMLSVLDTGWDLDGEWIESWSIELSRLSPAEAAGSFLRTVNNPNVPAGFDWKVFSSVFEGTFKREPRT